MQINNFGEVEISADELFSAIYNNPKLDISKLCVNNIIDVEKFNGSVKTNGDFFHQLRAVVNKDETLQEFDKKNQNNWFIPEEYATFDIVNWLYDQCKTDVEKDRVTEELELFVQFNMFNVLIFLKYLVDTMRSNKIVWGVGRGSSVASYCLYLIGIHKINSIKYDLDIKEFLK